MYCYFKKRPIGIALISAIINGYWLYSLWDYFRIMPDNESGSVILGMIVITPFLMLLTSFLAFPLYKLFDHFRHKFKS